MGRKKKKAVDENALETESPDSPSTSPVPESTSLAIKDEHMNEEADGDVLPPEEETNKAPLKSGYAMTTHSAEIVDEDIYVSEGSDEEDEDPEDAALRDIELVVAGSRMGIMRRGIHHPMLVQPNRQWTKETNNTLNASAAGGGIGDQPHAEGAADAEEQAERLREEELAKLDPAQRAARLLAEKQRKLEEAKELARRVESEENAGRDPCLFSKRTAFDIRFDQIDDKPWTRGDITDFFNYGLTEEDWLEYSQQQLTIRQELTDASRQRRPADPTIVPVAPRAPAKQTPKVAVAGSGADASTALNASDAQVSASDAPLGPVLVKKEAEGGPGPAKKDQPVDVPVGVGGAWGAGAVPGSMLAKLISQQTGDTMDTTSEPANRSDYGDYNNSYAPPVDSGSRDPRGDYNNGPPGGGQDWNSNYGSYGPSHYGSSSQPPPPPMDQPSYGGPPPRGDRNFRGGRGGGRGGYHDNRNYGGRGGGYRQDQDHSRKRSRDNAHGDSRGGGGWRR
eukprot:Nitzschia sp. Nitz4//scaffold288_size23661//5438//6958//NITZ4_008467-RA/size23661-processed-gene-0.37-mRNA-1//1//CDS//3329545791//8681//frame0